MKVLLTATEAAVRIGVSSGRVHQLIGEGKLMAERKGRFVRVNESEVTRYIRENCFEVAA